MHPIVQSLTNEPSIVRAVQKEFGASACLGASLESVQTIAGLVKWSMQMYLVRVLVRVETRGRLGVSVILAVAPVHRPPD